MAAYVRTVRTRSGATSVQIAWSSRRGSRRIEHLGPAHTAAQVEVLKAAGRQRIAAPSSYRTIKRRLPLCAKDGFRQALSKVCAAHAALGPGCLVPYDVSTLCSETDAGDGSREPGFSTQRRLEPQITIGLLTDAAGFPLAVLDTKIPHVPHQVQTWRRILRGIDEQVARAQKAVDGKIAVKRNRFIKLSGAATTVDRELEAKARDLARIKGYTTNLTDDTPEFVIDAYHRLEHYYESSGEVTRRPV